MGSNMPNLKFGKPYEFKPSKVPGPGSYNTETGLCLTKSRSSTALIASPTRPNRQRSQSGTRPDDHNIGPGSYNPFPKFGHSEKKFTIGRPYEFKPNKNPPPGLYDLEQAWNQVIPRTAAVQYRQKVGADKKP